MSINLNLQHWASNVMQLLACHSEEAQEGLVSFTLAVTLHMIDCTSVSWQPIFCKCGQRDGASLSNAWSPLIENIWGIVSEGAGGATFYLLKVKLLIVKILKTRRKLRVGCKHKRKCWSNHPAKRAGSQEALCCPINYLCNEIIITTVLIWMFLYFFFYCDLW